jgi:hypothetical protein
MKNLFLIMFVATLMVACTTPVSNEPVETPEMDTTVSPDTVEVEMTTITE